MVEKSWFEKTELGECCSCETHCEECEPSGNCDSCDTIDGRCIEAVCEYASTCDNCGELTSHDEMEMDPETQFGYCLGCVPKLSQEIRDRLPE